MSNYTLKGKTPIPVDDILKWAKSFENQDRRVAKTMIGKVRVSTVFLGIDYSFGEGPPLLFETMVFGGALDQEEDRYCTWEQAETGHKKMVEKVKLAEGEDNE